MKLRTDFLERLENGELKKQHESIQDTLGRGRCYAYLNCYLSEILIEFKCLHNNGHGYNFEISPNQLVSYAEIAVRKYKSKSVSEMRVLNSSYISSLMERILFRKNFKKCFLSEYLEVSRVI